MDVPNNSHNLLDKLKGQLKNAIRFEFVPMNWDHLVKELLNPTLDQYSFGHNLTTLIWIIISIYCYFYQNIYIIVYVCLLPYIKYRLPYINIFYYISYHIFCNFLCHHIMQIRNTLIIFHRTFILYIFIVKYDTRCSTKILVLLIIQQYVPKLNDSKAERCFSSIPYVLELWSDTCDPSHALSSPGPLHAYHLDHRCCATHNHH